jgi:hypothetical protein
MKRTKKITFIRFASYDANCGVPVFAMLHTRFLYSEGVKKKRHEVLVRLEGAESKSLKKIKTIKYFFIGLGSSVIEVDK